MEYTVEFFQKSADYVMSIIKGKPEIAIILGSGLGDFVSKIKNPIEIKYDDIPNFLVSTVASHAGKLIYGEVGGKKVICMAGRFHSYEGYDFEQLVIPVRLSSFSALRRPYSPMPPVLSIKATMSVI